MLWQSRHCQTGSKSTLFVRRVELVFSRLTLFMYLRSCWNVRRKPIRYTKNKDKSTKTRTENPRFTSYMRYSRLEATFVSAVWDLKEDIDFGPVAQFAWCRGEGRVLNRRFCQQVFFEKRCDVIRVTWLTRPCGLFTLWIRCQRVFMFSSFLPAALKISRFHYTNDLITLFGMVKKREIGEYQWLVRTCADFRTLIDSSQRKQ